MTHIEKEISEIKEDLIELWEIVNSQLTKANQSLQTFDKDLAREIISKEKKVNSLELKLERNCENTIALFNPVAMDLRFILAVLKINSNLERIGDIAAGLAKFIKESDEKYDVTLLETIKIKEMFVLSSQMLESTLNSFEIEDTSKAREILKYDDELDKINRKATKIIAEYCRTNSDNIEFALYLLNCIRKLERVGDQTKNIIEEIIFYIDAKVIRHKETKKKKK